MTPHAARDALAARDLWQAPASRFDDDEEGIDGDGSVSRAVIELAGSTDLACHLVFEVERDYWQSRNAAAQCAERPARIGWAGMGEPRSSYVSLLTAVLSARDRHVHAAGISASRAISCRGARRAGEPRSSNIR